MTIRDISEESEIAGLNLTVVPVEKLIFSGFQTNFARVFNVLCAWTTSTDRVKSILKYTNGTVQYPYVTFYLSSTQEGNDRDQTHESARHGRTAIVNADTQDRRSYRVHSVPVDFVVNAQLVTNSYDNVLEFLNSWYIARRLKWLNFDIAYGTTQFGISVTLDPDISIPLREADPEVPQVYEIDLGITIHGHVSYSELMEEQLANTIEVTAGVQDTTSKNVMWSFKQKPEDTYSGVALRNVPGRIR